MVVPVTLLVRVLVVMGPVEVTTPVLALLLRRTVLEVPVSIDKDLSIDKPKQHRTGDRGRSRRRRRYRRRRCPVLTTASGPVVGSAPSPIATRWTM